MLPFASVAVGLLLVTVDLHLEPLGGVDVLLDPVGWLMVMSGTGRLDRRHRAFGVAEGFGVAGLLSSLVAFVPKNESDAVLFGIADSIIQTGLVVAVCTGLRSLAASDGRTRRSAGLIRWVDVALTVAAVPLALTATPGALQALETLNGGSPGFGPLAGLLILAGIAVRLWFLVLVWSRREAAYAVA